MYSSQLNDQNRKRKQWLQLFFYRVTVSFPNGNAVQLEDTYEFKYINEISIQLQQRIFKQLRYEHLMTYYYNINDYQNNFNNSTFVYIFLLTNEEEPKKKKDNSKCRHSYWVFPFNLSVCLFPWWTIS